MTKIAAAGTSSSAPAKYFAAKRSAQTIFSRLRVIAAAGAILCFLAFAAAPVHAQGSRKDDIVFGPDGHPVADATVRVCQSGATGTPCTPLATIYTDATLTVTAPNPFQTDGIGNYHFYAPSGRYEVQISAPQINGTVTNPDVILPPDTSTIGSGSNISAFSLTLGGNLSVAGNASITGTLTAENFNPGSFSPSSLNVGGNASFKGPSPWVDITQYGARSSTSIGSSVGVGCTSGSATITGAPSALQNGDGVIVYNCGASVTIAAPAAPSITTGATQGAEAWDVPIAAVTGGTSTYNYKIIERDAAGGLSAAGTAASIATGPATLGLQTCAITSGTLSGNTLTLTPASACAIPAGAAVGYKGGTSFTDVYSNVTSVAGGNIAIQVNRNSAYQTTTTTTGGTVYWWWANQLALPALPGGATKYYVCAQRPGDSSYHLVWTGTSTTWNDFGWNESGFPINVSDAACNNATAGADPLSATVASGGGTTTITLSTTASQTSSGAAIYIDDEPAIAAACTAANAAGTSIFIPTGTFWTYYPLTMNCGVRQLGTLNIDDTITLAGRNWTTPSSEGSSAAQFQQRPNVSIGCNGDPCLLVSGSVGGIVSGLQFTYAANSEGVQLNGLNLNLSYDNFVGGGSTDYGGVGLHIVGGNYGYDLEHLNFLGGPGQSGNGYEFSSTAPELWIDGPNNSVKKIEDVQFNARAIYFVQDYGTSPGTITRICDVYNQGGIMPNLVFQNLYSASYLFTPIICGAWTEDTSNQANLAYLQQGGSFTGPAVISGTFVNAGAGSQITGAPFAYVMQNGDLAPGATNRSTQGATNLYANDSVDLNTGPHFRSYSLLTGPVIQESGTYVPLGFPTLSAPTLSAGGSVPTGNHTYSVNPVDWGNGWGAPSNAQTIAVTSGNQTVNLSWTAVQGAAGYQIRRDGFFLTAGNGPGSGVSCSAGTCTYTDTAQFTAGWTAPVNYPGSAGAEGFSAAAKALFAPKLIISSSNTSPYEADFSGTFTADHHYTLQDVDGVPAIINGSVTDGDCPKLRNLSGAIYLQDNGSACGAGGGMVYPGAGIPVSTGTAWSTSYNTTCNNGLTFAASAIGCLSAAPVKSGDAAGGDLSGTYPNPSVAKVNGSTPGGSCATAGDVVTSLDSSARPSCSDSYRVMEIPFSNDQSGTAGKGWSIDTACGAGPTATVRNGTNISTGYYQYAASQNACAQLTIPENWDSATNPWVQVNFTQAGSTASQTIAFQIQIGCSTTTDDPSFATAQAFTTTTTGATANTPYFHTLQLNSTSMTSCGANQVMNLKLSTTASSNGAANAEMFTIYWPLKPTTAPTAN